MEFKPVDDAQRQTAWSDLRDFLNLSKERGELVVVQDLVAFEIEREPVLAGH